MEAAIEAVGEFGEVPRKHVRRRVPDARGTRRKHTHPHIRADVYPGDGGAHDFAGRGESNRTRRPLILGTDANRSMGRPLARRKSIWMAAATRRSWRKRSATAAMSSLLREEDCWTSNSDNPVGRFSAPMKRFAKDTVTPFRESKPQIYLGRSPRESLSARAPTQAVGSLKVPSCDHAATVAHEAMTANAQSARSCWPKNSLKISGSLTSRVARPGSVSRNGAVGGSVSRLAGRVLAQAGAKRGAGSACANRRLSEGSSSHSMP